MCFFFLAKWSGWAPNASRLWGSSRAMNWMPAVCRGLAVTPHAAARWLRPDNGVSQTRPWQMVLRRPSRVECCRILRVGVIFTWHRCGQNYGGKWWVNSTATCIILGTWVRPFFRLTLKIGDLVGLWKILSYHIWEACLTPEFIPSPHPSLWPLARLAFLSQPTSCGNCLWSLPRWPASSPRGAPCWFHPQDPGHIQSVLHK